jgi:hypothetical protein
MMNQPTPKKTKVRRPRFETGKCIVQMRGQHYHTVTNPRVTPPEYLLMQEVHGPDSIRFVEKTGYRIETRLSENGQRQQRFMPRSELIEYLKLRYTEKTFNRVFPGNNPNLPYTFDDIEVVSDAMGPDMDDDEWEPMPRMDQQPGEVAKINAPAENTADVTGSEADTVDLGDDEDDFADLDDDEGDDTPEDTTDETPEVKAEPKPTSNKKKKKKK